MQKNLQLLDKSIKSIECARQEMFHFNLTIVEVVFSDGIVAEHHITSRDHIDLNEEILENLIDQYDLSNFTADDFIDEFFQDIDEVISSSAIGGRTC